MQDLIQFLNNFTHEILYIQFGLLLLLFVAIAMVWAYNRKKYQELSHQIPAGVVKSYLDSIIQNSTSLKSSLFRGGGLDLTQGIPSVLPIGGLKGGDSVSVDSEMLNQKNAEIAALHAKLSEKNRTVADLEGRIKELESSKPQGSPDAAREVGALKNQVKDLEAKLKGAQEALEKAKAGAGAAAGGGDAALKKELETVTKERDELKERLQEYEIIEDDLANLKKLQQENDQLRKALEAAGVEAPASELPKKDKPAPKAEAAAPEAAAAPAPAAAAPEPEAAAPAAEPEAPAAEAAAPAEPAAAAPEAAAAPAAAGNAPETAEQGKSAEDLLSEFEKMLG